MQDEIARLQAADEQARSDAYAQQCAAELDAWSRADSIDHLKQVIDAAREAMRVPVRGDDGDVIGYDFDPSAARVIRDTVETLNKMQGFNEPEKSEVDARVSVEFADGDDLAV